ncbi:hypothetical protein [Propionibacterium acidifaciens]|uniref:hypothetical protein n=1 Tax=Propionibacterium acidifaciens TaxID=556499 RepID=UPI0012DF71F6|nr:hypothetical protein [Propionibacterium acidifaciens]
MDRQRTSQSFSDALPPTSRTVAPYPTEQNRDTWQTTLAPDRLQRETEAARSRSSRTTPAPTTPEP